MNASPSGQHPHQHMAASATAAPTVHAREAHPAAPRPDVTRVPYRLDSAGLTARYCTEKGRRNGPS